MWRIELESPHNFLLFYDTTNRHVGQVPNVGTQGLVVIESMDRNLKLFYPSLNNTNPVEVSYGMHSHKLEACDILIDKHLLATVGSDGLRLFDLFTGVLLRAALLFDHLPIDVRFVESSGAFVCYIKTESKFLKCSWAKISFISKDKIRSIQQVNSAFISTKDTLDHLDLFGDYLHIKCEPLNIDICVNDTVYLFASVITILRRDISDKYGECIVCDLYSCAVLHTVQFTKEKVLNVVGAGRKFVLILVQSKTRFDTIDLKLIDLVRENQINCCKLPMNLIR